MRHIYVLKSSAVLKLPLTLEQLLEKNIFGRVEEVDGKKNTEGSDGPMGQEHDSGVVVTFFLSRVTRFGLSKSPGLD